MDEQPIRILVLDRGFVMVCRCPDPVDAGFWLTVRDARIIRRWGTQHGIGELCKGPKDGTQLDALVPVERIPVRAILRVIDVEEKRWSKHLAT